MHSPEKQIMSVVLIQGELCGLEFYSLFAMELEAEMNRRGMDGWTVVVRTHRNAGYIEVSPTEVSASEQTAILTFPCTDAAFLHHESFSTADRAVHAAKMAGWWIDSIELELARQDDQRDTSLSEDEVLKRHELRLERSEAEFERTMAIEERRDEIERRRGNPPIG
jgi:hypothetical protein